LAVVTQALSVSVHLAITAAIEWTLGNRVIGGLDPFAEPIPRQADNSTPTVRRLIINIPITTFFALVISNAPLLLSW
jgi:hypothetical protein